jgi:hypothetical protein
VIPGLVLVVPMIAYVLAIVVLGVDGDDYRVPYLVAQIFSGLAYADHVRRQFRRKNGRS